MLGETEIVVTRKRHQHARTAPRTSAVLAVGIYKRTAQIAGI
jgi:hypothetical protein